MKQVFVRTLYTLFAFCILVINMSTARIVHSINAQSSTVTVSPAFAELRRGETYTLSITNTTNQPISTTLSPTLLIIQEDGFIPASPDLLQTLTIRFSDHMSISENQLTIEAGQRAESEITYVSPVPGYALGVSVRPQTTERDQVAIGSEIISILLDTQPSRDTISTNISVSAPLRLGSIILGGNYSVTTTVRNDSSSFIKPTGEVIMQDNDTRLQGESLTAQIYDFLYPSQEVTAQVTFTEQRSLFDKLGNTTFTQTIVQGENTYIETYSIFILPWEILAGGILVIIVSIIIFRRVYKKRKEAIRGINHQKRTRTKQKTRVGSPNRAAKPLLGQKR